jgi:hypothetical protein
VNELDFWIEQPGSWFSEPLSGSTAMGMGEIEIKYLDDYVSKLCDNSKWKYQISNWISKANAQKKDLT